MVKKIEDKKQIKLIYFFGIAFLVFVIFFLLNCKTGYISDDFVLRNIYEGYPVASRKMIRVTSLYDIFKGMSIHYMLLGGRIPSHSIAQVFLMFSKTAFNICNSMVTVFLGFLIYFYANYGKKRNFLLFVLIYSVLWFFIPDAPETMLWLTCTINYMWTCVCVLIFLIPYRIYSEHNNLFRHSSFLSFLMVPVGLLAGWSNETAGGVAGLMALFYIYNFIRNKFKIPFWSLSGIVSVAVGFAILLFAPGNIVRAKTDLSTGAVTQNINLNFNYNFHNVFHQSFVSLWPLLLILFISIVILLNIRKKSSAVTRTKQKMGYNNIYTASTYILISCFISAFVSCAVLIVSPIFSPRSLFITAVLLMISIGSVIASISAEVSIAEKVKIIIAVLLVAACCISVSTDAIIEYRICSYNYGVQTEVEEYAANQVKQGQKNIVLTGEYFINPHGRFNLYNPRLGIPLGVFDYPALDGTFLEKVVNTFMASYFGADTFTSEARIIYTKD